MRAARVAALGRLAGSRRKQATTTSRSLLFVHAAGCCACANSHLYVEATCDLRKCSETACILRHTAGCSLVTHMLITNLTHAHYASHSHMPLQAKHSSGDCQMRWWSRDARVLLLAKRARSGVRACGDCTLLRSYLKEDDAEHPDVVRWGCSDLFPFVCGSCVLGWGIM
jgi:hypothetical protein